MSSKMKMKVLLKSKEEEIVKLMIAFRLEAIVNELGNIINSLSLMDFDEDAISDLIEAYNKIKKSKEVLEENVDSELVMLCLTRIKQ